MTGGIAYSLFNPSGNMTLLVETPVPEPEQPALAKRLMEREPETEQVGFVKVSDGGIALRMAGGEFCGNASMSAAFLFMLRTGRRSGTVPVSVSGTPEPVAVSLEALTDGLWRGSVRMPRPLSVGLYRFPDGRELPLVRFPGISHVILQKEADPSSSEALASTWCRELKAEALGLMFLDSDRSRLTPLVYVPAADTMFWESSCASGTTAVGAYLAAEGRKALRLSLKQPGGTLEIEAGPDSRLILSGTVQLVRQGTL